MLRLTDIAIGLAAWVLTEAYLTVAEDVLNYMTVKVSWCATELNRLEIMNCGACPSVS